MIIVRTLQSSNDKNKRIKIIQDGRWFWFEDETGIGNGYIYNSLQSALLGVYEALAGLIVTEKQRSKKQ